MQRCLLKGKIHRATVTDANSEYEGSISIDSALMAAADIVPYEMVQLWSVTSGERIETYAIPAEENSGTVCVNGAAALRIGKGEVIIIAAFAWMDEAAAAGHRPRVVLVDGRNRASRSARGAGAAAKGSGLPQERL